MTTNIKPNTIIQLYTSTSKIKKNDSENKNQNRNIVWYY